MMRAAALFGLLSSASAQSLPRCSGDFQGDGDVDVADVLTVLESFQVNANGDTDGNGVTDTVVSVGALFPCGLFYSYVSLQLCTGFAQRTFTIWRELSRNPWWLSGARMHLDSGRLTNKHHYMLRQPEGF
jgi:hypothetical protein